MKPRAKYEVIFRNRQKYPVVVMCQYFKVSRSGYYSYLNQRERADRDEGLAKLIAERRAGRFGRSLGCRKMQRWLEKVKGIRLNYKTVWRVMRKYGLLSECRRKRFYRQGETFHVYPNLLNRKFNSEKPNTKWVTDITYIPTSQGTVYLSTILDLHDRSIVSYKTSTRNDSKLVTDTLKQAMRNQNVTVERQLHSDQGSQYTSREYFNLTQEYGITPSMSRRANPYDNAVMESFFSLFKTECIYLCRPKTISHATTLVHDYIDFYNTDRMILK